MMVLDALFDLVFPPKCVLCGGILGSGERDLCGACGETLKNSPVQRKVSGLDGAVAVWYYEGSVRESLLRYKFSGKRNYARSYGRLLSKAVSRCLPRPDVITWVPVSKKRKRRRGYDQAELLARALGRELGIPVKPMLQKVRDNPAQSGLTDSRARKENVKNVYRPIPGGLETGQRLLLVDDILTTGATASECARTLRGGGAGQVMLAAMAAGRDKQHT